MQFILPIYLCSKQYGEETSEIGEAPETLIERKVYASEESAKRQEFYQANANGYKIEKVLTIRKFEYGNEEIVKIGPDGSRIEYTVLRTYDKQDGNIELTLTKGVSKDAGT
ncbi:phage head closure protein [Mobilitalea sibirica]|uniref:Phage head closure protein n=1 Tax=Mobilitalea sibirica TaxID=1462919 RepID=A0A8J7H3G8_9FIRM|nr:phage head closure protein [Mobilitalea sibirica]MBH1941638.1 phage head closure protein [Mobilitalea sibirica]